MKPVCCSYEMRVKQCGVTVVELAGAEPYKLYHADVLECRVCGREVLYGFGNPIAHTGDAELSQATVQPGVRFVRDHTRIKWAQPG